MAFQVFGDMLVDTCDVAYIVASPLSNAGAHSSVEVGYKGGLVKTFSGDVATAIRTFADEVRADALKPKEPDTKATGDVPVQEAKPEGAGPLGPWIKD